MVPLGSLQQHLTRKTVNTDVAYLAMWSGEAAELIEEVRTRVKRKQIIHSIYIFI